MHGAAVASRRALVPVPRREPRRTRARRACAGGVPAAYFRVGGRTFDRQDPAGRLTFQGAQHLQTLGALTDYDRCREDAERNWPWERWQGDVQWRDAALVRARRARIAGSSTSSRGPRRRARARRLRHARRARRHRRARDVAAALAGHAQSRWRCGRCRGAFRGAADARAAARRDAGGQACAHRAAAHVQSGPRAALDGPRPRAQIPADEARCSAAGISSASRSKRRPDADAAAARRRRRETPLTMPNRLAGETSPYLLQHADNPVDWYPWGDEALARARARGQADPAVDRLLGLPLVPRDGARVVRGREVAAVMNEHFVNIKVDREERPDLDQIYQTAHALLDRRSGGWPLTMFLTPGRRAVLRRHLFPEGRALRPAGFPRAAAARGGRLPRAAAPRSPSRARSSKRRAREPRARTPAASTPAGGRRRPPRSRSSSGASTPCTAASARAPKFPHPTDLEFCLRAHARTGDAEALAIVRDTLERMADGGIHDQLGGGFCRYWVDAEWTIPHFEKMLYDNGPLLALYADLARVDRRRALRATWRAASSAGWCARCARTTARSSRASTPTARARKASSTSGRPTRCARCSGRGMGGRRAAFGLDGRRISRARAGTCASRVPLADVAARLGDLAARTRRRGSPRAKAALFAARATRVRPGRDDKILTPGTRSRSPGSPRAARALDEPRWADLASPRPTR